MRRILLLAFACLLIPACSASATPVARLTISPQPVVANTTTTFNGASSSCDRTPCTYRWYHPTEFDTADGTLDTSASFVYTHVDLPSETHTVKLTVRNSVGQSNSVSVPFKVIAAQPTPTPTPSPTATPAPTSTPTPSPTPTPTPSPTPTATPDPTPTPTPTGSFPDATSTGVPDGTVLHACPATITAPGTYDACQFSGGLVIKSSGVSVTRSLITGQVYDGNWQDDLKGLQISDSTIDCGCRSVGATDTPVAIMYNNFTLTRVEVLNAGHGVAMGSNVTVRDSWIHGLGNDTDAHKDGIYVGDGTNSVIDHNTIECADGPVHVGCTAAIGLLTDFAPITYFTITNNLLNTLGSYCFYAAGGPQKPYGSNHLTFTGNHFGRKFRANCGYYGPVTYWDSSAPGMVWSGNVWDDTGAPVSPAY